MQSQMIPLSSDTSPQPSPEYYACGASHSLSFTPEQLTEIEKFASIFLPVSDIAEILGVHPAALRSEIASDSPAAKAYRRGKASLKVEILKQERKFALVGSPLALENLSKALAEMEDDE